MATLYVKSGSSNTAPYDTWAKAATTLKTAMEAAAAGDTIYVSHQHAESQGAAMSIGGTGTLTAPLKVLCANDGAEPPTSLATTATVTTTGNFALTINGSHYCYGIIFSCSSGNVAQNLSLNASAANHSQVYDSCKFRHGSTNTGSNRILMGANGTQQIRSVRWINCDAKFGAGGSQVIAVTFCAFEWIGGSIESGSATPTAVFEPRVSASLGSMRVQGVDFSNLSSSMNLFFNTSTSPYGEVGALRNCKLPASWSGSLLGAALGGEMFSVAMHNCDSGDTNYRLWMESYLGSVKSETTIVRTGGASDGTTPLSWKMASNANAEYPTLVLFSPEIVIWNDTSGASKTVTVEIVTDNVTLTDDECWLEVMYLGTSGFPITTRVADAKADVLASAANQTSSSVTWTTTGLTTPVKQSLAVTFTPQEKGPIVARVCLAKASTTVYVDPVLTVS